MDGFKKYGCHSGKGTVHSPYILQEGDILMFTLQCHLLLHILSQEAGKCLSGIFIRSQQD